MDLLFWLVVGHSVADYPLQGDFLARGKNHSAPLPGVPWLICLMAHAAIHAGAVALATGSVALGCAEFVIHCAIDYGKCDGRFGFVTDQILHVGCKVVWVVCAVGGVPLGLPNN
jgi:hypothetical protein